MTSTAARSVKVAMLAAALREAGSAEVGVASAYLSGEHPQRRTGVGHRSLSGLPGPAEEPTLTLAEVDAAIKAMSTTSGAGSTTARRSLLTARTALMLTGSLPVVATEALAGPPSTTSPPGSPSWWTERCPCRCAASSSTARRSTCGRTAGPCRSR